MKRKFSRLALMFLLPTWLVPVCVLAVNPCVVLPDGRKVEGTEVHCSPAGVVFLTTVSGRLEYPKGTKVVMDEPLELKQAVALLQKKQYDEAILILEKVAENCRFLGWDFKARKLHASAYNSKEDWKKAASEYELLMADFPESRDDEELRAGYMKALSGNGDTDKVMPLLKAAIAKGPRAEAAQGQMIRARASLESGDVEGALYDFMRTARYFRESKELAAEAAFRAGECLEKLGDAERAGAYFRLASDVCPESPYAGQAKVKSGAKP